MSIAEEIDTLAVLVPHGYGMHEAKAYAKGMQRAAAIAARPCVWTRHGNAAAEEWFTTACTPDINETDIDDHIGSFCPFCGHPVEVKDNEQK